MVNIKDLLSRLMLLCRLERAIVDELDTLSQRVYGLEEKAKLRDASILDLKKDVGELKLQVRREVRA